MNQLKVSFEELFNHIKMDGVYLAEDLHTAYWLEYGGGYKRRNTFIEYSKNFIDQLNAFHSRQRRFKVDSFTKSVDSLHYYDSILVIEKRTKEKPFHEKTGEMSFVHARSIKESTLLQKINHKLNLKKRTLTVINKILRFFRLPGFIWK